MAEPRAFIVDVFAQARHGGNPLAVVVFDEPLPPAAMLALAAEFNFSETTFVGRTPEANGGYRVHMYTPARELAFAGHPILGTAFVVRRNVLRTVAREIRLNLRVGSIPVSFDEDGSVWFRAPPTTLGRTVDRGAAAHSLGLAADDIDARWPVQEVGAGTSAILVPVRDLAALDRCALDLRRHAPLLAQGYPPLVYIFSPVNPAEAQQLRARFFFEANGVREDPATGNGAAFLGHYLLAHALKERGPLELRIDQGANLGRPSLVRVRARLAAEGPEVSVGGGVIPVLDDGVLDGVGPYPITSRFK